MIVLGRIGAPHGVRGWVKVQPYGDDPASWKRMPSWWIAENDAWRECRLEGCRTHQAGLVAKLSGVNDRDAAELIAGRLIGAPRDALPETRADEYYWADLVGLDVSSCEGAELGRVAELIDTGAHAVLRTVDAAGRERLIPFVEHVIREVDLRSGRLTVDWNADW